MHLDAEGWAAARSTCKGWSNIQSGIKLLEIDLERDAHRCAAYSRKQQRITVYIAAVQAVLLNRWWQQHQAKVVPALPACLPASLSSPLVHFTPVFSPVNLWVSVNTLNLLNPTSLNPCCSCKVDDGADVCGAAVPTPQLCHPACRQPHQPCAVPAANGGTGYNRNEAAGVFE